MPKRFATIATLIVAGLLVLASLPVASASAVEPWWQVTTGARPTHLWEPKDATEVQEVKTTKFEFPGLFAIYAAEVEVDGSVIGCLGTGSLAIFGGPTANQLCEKATGFTASESAAEFEAMLETPYGAGEVDVSGGPVGVAPFEIKSPWGPPVSLSVITAEPFGVPAGTASSNVLTEGSGRLVLTLTNLGDAPVDGSGSPVMIVDELPPGVIATGVEAVAGQPNSDGPVRCSIEAADMVSCSYADTLAPYRAIEIEILTALPGSPPAAGGPGRVSVSGGNASPISAMQDLQVSSEPVSFGIEQFSSVAEEEGGKPAARAGGHPFQFTNTIQLNAGAVRATLDRGVVGARYLTTDQPALPRNLRFSLPSGLIANATVMPQCDMRTFLHPSPCPDAAAVGVSTVTAVDTALGLFRAPEPVYNLPPARGEPARFGFVVAGVAVVIDTEVEPSDYRITARISNVSQLAQFLSATTTFWGTPGDPRHDNARGLECVVNELCERPEGLGEPAFMRMPVQCSSPLDFDVLLEPWNVPLGSQIRSASFTGDPLLGCSSVPFNPTIESAPTSRFAENPSGLDFKLSMPNSGLLNKDGVTEGQAKKVEVVLPEGVTINPSQAEGLGPCSPAEYAQETFESEPGEGCPQASKIGTMDISTPLLAEEAHGAVYVAEPYDNPFDSLLALYMVAKIPERGILVKQAGQVRLDPNSGQIVTTFDDLPQIPFSIFDLQFKDGARAPLVMPSTCGSYDIVAKFTPWNAADPDNPQPSEIVRRTSSFTVDHGPDGGACPSGTPPFKPGFTAGTENNAAGSYSPLDVRLTRQDGEQEFKTFSLKMPKGVIGKLAGIPFCSEAAIAAARARTGANGGQEELDNPSCPEASQIGRTLVGAGVGPTLPYAPGKLYLAGPYKGAKLSVVAITTAKVGPFDLGSVVVRQGLKVDPNTAEVSTDGSSGDPIPHILQGIAVHARDIRIYVDRKDFVLNPTSCERMTAAAAVIGSGLDFNSSADDQAADVSVPFQAADCASLGLKPKLSLKLRGGTRRAAHPSLKAILTARKGDANIGAAQVTLPHSEFLEQSHIRTICTRVQFAAGEGNGSQCPKRAVYGRAKAISPLLDEPLVGRVYLRSSNHPLPDLVAALHSKKVDINLVGRIDSVNGGIRNTFEAVPDAPVTKFVLEMQGGKKGLLVNSTNICQGKHRAKANFTGQNGKRRVFNPLVKARCGGKHSRRSGH
jgi:hypothetical protein